MKVIEQTFDRFPHKHLLASYRMFGRFSPAIFKKETGYGVRILKSRFNYGQGAEWEYFDLDETGLVMSSPRGMARQFNKKIRYTNMDEVVEEYKDREISP